MLGVLAGIVGTWQANEALKLLLGIGRPLIGRVLTLDALEGKVREFSLPQDPACALCGEHPTVVDALEMPRTAPPQTTVPELAAADLDAFLGGDQRAQVLDVREPHEIALDLLPRSVHIPATELAARMHELDSARTYIVACRVGAKSVWAAQRLWDAGFRRLRHLEGGLLAYAARDSEFEIF